MEGDYDGAGPVRGKGRTISQTSTLAPTTPSPRATQKKHASRLLDQRPSTSTPSSSGTPRKARLRPRQASCGVRVGTGKGDRPAHALAWILGVAVLLGGEGVASAGALVSKKKTIALVRHPAAGLAARRGVFVGAWERGRTSTTGGAVRRPTEDGGTMTRLWGKWGKDIFDSDIGEAYTILSGGGLEKRGFASQASAKSIKCYQVKTSREMSGQGFSSTSVMHSSDGMAKKRSAGKAANKRRRRSPPFVEQRRIKVAEAETANSPTTEPALLEGETGEANVKEDGKGPDLTGVERLNGSVIDASEVPPAESIVKDEVGAMRTVRMRKFLPPKRRQDRNKKNTNKSTGEGEGKDEVEVDGGAEVEPLEALAATGAPTCEGTGEAQLSGAAAAREIVIAAESTSWGKELEEGEATAGGAGGDGDIDGGSKPRVRKCPPAVGFVSGFRDVRFYLNDGGVRGDQGAASSSTSSTGGGMAVGDAKIRNVHHAPPGVEALIRALSESLNSAPATHHVTAPRRWSSPSIGPDKPSSPRLSAGKNGAVRGPADEVGVNEANTCGARVGDSGGGGGDSASSAKQKRSKPQPDAAQLLHPGAIGGQGDEQLRIDPPMRSVSISFDPQADTLLSCITTNTDVYGEALHAPAVANMSRADVAAYLERWLLVSVKYGVAPRELRTLLQENQGVTLNFGRGGGVERHSDGFGVGREAGAGRSSPTWKHHGSWDRGKWGNEDAPGGGSWTKYGWKRLDRPYFDNASSSSGSETVRDRSPPVGSERESLAGSPSPLSTAPRGYGADGEAGVESAEVLESEGDEETEEEEMMESVAEALVGGDGRRDADYNWRMTKSASQEAAVESNDYAASDGYAGWDVDTRYSRLLEGSDTSEMSSGAWGRSGGEREGNEEELKEERTSSLGWRVLEVMEARFKSGLHPPRIVAIGDVHGCLEELKDLVRKVEYWPGDLLLFLGDLVAKGPDSAGAVRLARELGGVTVRGNHEFEVLRWLNVDVHGDNRVPSAHHKIALSLSEEDASWLKASPWYFRCDDLGSLFVHAGFASGVSMSKQNPRMMMNMRSVSDSGLITSKVLEMSPWASLYTPDDLRNRNACGRHWSGPDTVFFGHDAERGLQLMDHAVGIDTGCVYGGRLTACILPERRLVSVASKAAYIAYGKRRGSSSGSGSGSGGKVKNRKSYGRHRTSPS